MDPIWSSSFSTWVCRYFGCSGPPWAHVLDFNLAHVRLFQTPDFCEASVFPGGGGSLFFSACVGSRPASNFHPQKYHEFQAPKNILPEPTYIWKYQIPPPPGECSRCPSESDKTGVMKIATKERDIDNDVIVYIVIGDAYQIFRQTLSIKQ